MDDLPAARGSIRRTLLLSLGALFVAGMLLLFLAARGYGRRAADDAYDHLLNASALAIADRVTFDHGQWQVDLPYVALNLLAMAPEDRVFYRVAAPGGQTLTGYDDVPRAPAKKKDGITFFDADYSGERVRFISLDRRVSSPDRVGVVTIEVGQTRRARESLISDMAWRATLAIGLLTVAALAVLWFVVNRALRPLVRLERELRARDPSDLRPLQDDMPQEMRQMLGALNRFMARLGENLDTLRAFVGDAAHQLRTPLAALHAQAQLAVDEDDPQEQKRCLLAIERNARVLTRLTNQLLSDASVLHREHLRRFEPIDFAHVIRQALHESVPHLEPRPVVLTEGLDSVAPMRGDALMLREAIKNLVDNALKYGAPQRGPLQIALLRIDGGLRVVLTDHGPGIASVDAERLFERFHRGATSGEGGAGLGLAIVRRVVRSHGGEITLSNRVEGGLKVILDLPGRWP